MKKLIFLFLLIIIFFTNSSASTVRRTSDIKRYKQQAHNVTIIRDDWGIAHVYGKTDADTVFGAIYAQAEDDFNRVETNYINAMGRLAEVEGEAAIWRDLRMKLFIDPEVLKKEYKASPPWLKKLMNAWADGLNFYLAKHPQVKPRLITHFEPWMVLSFTEGSIGGDIESINLEQLQAFYENRVAVEANTPDPFLVEPTGSNGIAISPSNTINHNSLFLINPHTSFFFRSELQMVSGEGLNAYGAATWGQIFIYQGFNERCGWMHTSSSADAIDTYLETIVKKGDQLYYKYGNEERPVITSTIKIPYKTDKGMVEKTFTAYHTQHGPIVLSTKDKWVSVSLMQEHIKALTQSFMRIKSKNYKEFRQLMELHTNSSNNTVFADADGNIAYFHANFIPKRNPKFDWTKPVDGSDPATDWQGLLSVDETPKLLNPATGWLYNSNDSPWTSAGPNSPKKSDYPTYIDSGIDSARGMHAIKVLQDKKDFTLDSLMAAAYDSYLTWFEKPMPALIKAWDEMPASNPLKAKLSEQITLLRNWDLRWSETSVQTSLAVFWGTDIQQKIKRSGLSAANYIASECTAEQLLESLSNASDKLTTNFGSWKTPWGNINRFQRLTDDIVHPFSDTEPSIPVAFTSEMWGSLASFGASPYKGSKKIYGTSGNSFVAVIEFGKPLRAKAITAGGASGDPSSPHFNDQVKRYSTGDLREVYFYRSQLKSHTEKIYHPGN